MVAPKAPLLDGSGKAAREVSLEVEIFGAEPKPNLVHEAVRAELNARRAGTRGAKSRGLVAGGRGKPWRQKGTGRARQGTIRAPHFKGGGVAFPPTARSFEVKVNRKAMRAAFRAALTAHASGGTIALLDAGAFAAPSTKQAAALADAWGKPKPLVLVVVDGEDAIAKSFRNLERVAVTTPDEVEVAALVWARSLIVTESALEVLQRRASL